MMAPSLRFSVVLPTHNRPRRLLAACESVLDQTFSKFDLWIVDDGSSAESRRVCSVLARNPRVHVIRNDEPLGAAASRNRGIRAATGEYVAFIDDDCAWHPRRLECVDALLRSDERKLGYVCTQTVLLQRGPPIRFTVDPVLQEGEAPWRVGAPMIIARRDTLLDVGGFDERLPRSHDWDLAVRLVDRVDWALLSQPLVWAEDIPGLTSDPSKLQRASRILLEKYDRRSPVSRRLTVQFHRSFAHKVLLLGHSREGVRHYLHAGLLAPFFMRNWVTLCLAFGGAEFYRFVTGLVRSGEPGTDQ